MPPGTAGNRDGSAWKPHADDEADVRSAMDCANRGSLLSADASERFVRWLEGNGDDSWRSECE